LPAHADEGFHAAHEQFIVPQLIELGTAAEQAGFGLLATSDHLQPRQANEGTPVRLGSRWARWDSARIAPEKVLP